MEELADVDKAIEFAKEQDDRELWDDLISYSIDKPRMRPDSTAALSAKNKKVTYNINNASRLFSSL